MSIKRLFYKLVVLLSAFSLFWIIAGSVIEFHQKYVFHNHVELWQAITCKNVKDDKKSFQQLDKDFLLKSYFSLFKTEGVNDTESLDRFLKMEDIFNDLNSDLITQHFRPDMVFRGPPMA